MMTNDDAETPTSQNANADGDTERKKHITVGNYDVAIDNDKLPHVGIIASSIILLIAITVQDGVRKDYRSYGISLGSIALIISVASMIKVPNVHTEQMTFVVNYFLFCWCFIGACILTFGKGPFDETGNGYFASWAMAVFSAMTIGYSSSSSSSSNISSLREATKDISDMVGLGACAIVVFMALMADYKEWYWVRGEMICAIIVSLLTLLAVVNFTYARIKTITTLQHMEYPTLVLCSLLWIVSSCMTTFRGPFLVTSNGYLASWGGCILAVKAAITAHKDVHGESSGGGST